MQVVNVRFINDGRVNWLDSDGFDMDDVDTSVEDYPIYSYFDFFKKPAKVGELVVVPVKGQEFAVAQVVGINYALKKAKYPILSKMPSIPTINAMMGKSNSAQESITRDINEESVSGLKEKYPQEVIDDGAGSSINYDGEKCILT